MGGPTTWLDYSGGAVPGAELARAGIAGVCRYVGIGSGPKRLTAHEYADLIAHGIEVHGVVEHTTTDADSGYAGGLTNARAALVDINTLTGGRGLDVVYAANDKPTFIQADVDYVRAFRDVFGSRAGAYGFGTFLIACRAAGVASHFWLAGSPPSHWQLTGLVDKWQRQGTNGTPADGPGNPVNITLAGIDCDLNNHYAPRLPTVVAAVPAKPSQGDSHMYILCQPPPETTPRIGLLSGGLFVQLATKGEHDSANGNIKAGAYAQWVELDVWNALASMTPVVKG